MRNSFIPVVYTSVLPGEITFSAIKKAILRVHFSRAPIGNTMRLTLKVNTVFIKARLRSFPTPWSPPCSCHFIPNLDLSLNLTSFKHRREATQRSAFISTCSSVSDISVTNSSWLACSLLIPRSHNTTFCLCNQCALHTTWLIDDRRSKRLLVIWFAATKTRNRKTGIWVKWVNSEQKTCSCLLSLIEIIIICAVSTQIDAW